jgi:ATP-dependent protease ClpP protease subunit
MMKNKVFFGVALALLLALVPVSSLSKDTKPAKSEVIVLSKGNTMVLNDEVNGESIGKVIAKAKELDAELNSSLTGKFKGNSTKPLYLFLNTPGGSIQSGLELIEALKGVGRPIHTITLFAASMGFQIAQGLDDRLILKSGVLMSHRAQGEFGGEFGGQAPSQIDNRYQLWKDRMDELDAQTVERSKGKQTMESYQKQYASEMWLTGGKSVAQGYADKQVLVKCDSSLVGTSKHELMFMGLIKVTYELDNCPINTAPMNIQIGFTTTRGYMNAEDFVNMGGQFGSNCLVNNPNGMNLCALDTSLDLSKIGELKTKFLSHYEKKQKQVVPYRW